VDQDAVIAGRVPDAELAEYVERALARHHAVPELGQIEGGLDRESDLTCVTALQAGDGCLDAAPHLDGEAPARAPTRREEMPQCATELHHLPAPRRAAAAEAAASAAESAAAAEPEQERQQHRDEPNEDRESERPRHEPGDAAAHAAGRKRAECAAEDRA